MESNFFGDRTLFLDSTKQQNSRGFVMPSELYSNFYLEPPNNYWLRIEVQKRNVLRDNMTFDYPKKDFWPQTFIVV